MIRSIILVVVILILLILSIPLLLIELLLKKFLPKASDVSSHFLAKYLFKFLLLISGTKVTAIGTENIPSEGGVLFIGNHRSYFDILISYTYMKSVTGYVSKLEMNKIPVLNLWMGQLHCLFLDRDDVKQGLQTIISAIELIKKGTNIFIFPEGTRNKVNDTFMPFKAGSFKIATKSGCDIIPVSIVNSAGVFEDHSPKVQKAHVIIEFGQPIKVKEMSKEEQKNLPELTRNTIIEMYNKNKAAV